MKGGANKKTTAQFIADAELIHGDKYDYSHAVYCGAHTKVEIMCSKHNAPFWQAPTNHLRGKGCPLCSRENKTSDKVDGTRVCDTCNIDKPLIDFHVKGLHRRKTCKECVRGNVASKICSKCKEEKDVSEFGKSEGSRDGYKYYCNECRRGIWAEKSEEISSRRRKARSENLEEERQKAMNHYYKNHESMRKKANEYRANNADRLNKQQREHRARDPQAAREYESDYARKYYKSNKEKVATKNEKWRKNNRNQINIARNAWYHNNIESCREYGRKYCRNRRKIDASYRILCSLRGRIHSALRGVGRKSAKTIDLIGCSANEMRHHLEAQFRKGMTWDNHGKYGWHIDHIIPCSHFDLTKAEEQKKCFHFSNLQPLWAEDNLRKGNKVAA